MGARRLPAAATSPPGRRFVGRASHRGRVGLLLLGAGCLAVCTAACTQVEAPPAGASAQHAAPALPPAYATLARQRQRMLQEDLGELLAEVLPQIRALREQLTADVAAMDPPERLATADKLLVEWHREAWKEHQERVEARYERARVELEALQASATQRATAMARAMAPPASPLDAGPTGDMLLDQELTSFDETLRSELLLEQLLADQLRDALGRVELVQIWSSFRRPGADEALGGRLLLFVGGSESSEGPRCQLVFQAAEGSTPRGRVVQAMRHRIMKGGTLVQDEGWRLMPTEPPVSRFGSALFVGNLGPRLRSEAAGFSQLHDMRVLVDMQVALLDEAGQVRGGVDWRVEFRVTLRGEVSWQLGAAPDFNASCDEVARVLHGGGGPSSSPAPAPNARSAP